jgi:DNA-binding transcriptional ArsR family regulator
MFLGGAAKSIESLKGGGGRLGGVDPGNAVYRVGLAGSSTVVVKTFADSDEWHSELANLTYLGEIAPEHAPKVVLARDCLLVLEDLGPESLATACRKSEAECQEGWLLWADALAAIHARSAGGRPRLEALHRPDADLVGKSLSADEMLQILRTLADQTRRQPIPADDLRQLAACFRELERRIGDLTASEVAFGFHDPNTANVMLRDGRACFVDIGGAPLGVVCRAFGEVWRAPDRAGVIDRYRQSYKALGGLLPLRSLGEEGSLYSITVCIQWLQWHLEAAPEGGIPDIDGVKHGYAVAERRNLEEIRDLASDKKWLAPLRQAAVRLMHQPMAATWNK